jgi:TolB protein
MELAIVQLGKKDQGQNSGIPIPIGEIKPLLKPDPGIPQFDAHIHPDGSRITYVHDILQGTDGKLHIHTAKIDGTESRIAIPYVAFEESPRWSPDGKQLLWVSTRNGNQELYKSGPQGESIVRLTNHPDADNQPWWSSDGKEIVFVSYREGGARLFKMKSDGSSAKRLIPPRPGQGSPVSGMGSESWPVWAPKGDRIAFSCLVEGQSEIFTVKSDGTDLRRITDHAAQDTFPAWTPDGKTLLFCSGRDGGTDIYAVQVP